MKQEAFQIRRRLFARFQGGSALLRGVVQCHKGAPWPQDRHNAVLPLWALLV
jgi:hypothetical protein